MAKLSKVEEFAKHLSVIYNRKSSDTLYREGEIAVLAQRERAGRLKYPSNWDGLESDVVRQIEADKKSAFASYEVLRGHFTVEAAIEECASLLQSAKDRAAGKDVSIPECVVTFLFLDAEYVSLEDVAKVEELQREAQSVVAGVKEQAARVQQSISDAMGRASGDESLSKKLTALEKKRKAALLAGKDLSKLDAEILAMRDAIEANEMAMRMAEKDAEALTEHSENLAAILVDTEEALAQITAKASSLFCYVKIREINEKAEELASMVREVAEAKRRTWRRDPVTWGCVVMAGTPSCGTDTYQIPMWQERGSRPDGNGGINHPGRALSISIPLYR